MTLRTARPSLHPQTRVFWFRTAVPKDPRARVGKREEPANLKTKHSAEVEARRAKLRAGSCKLTEREVHALTGSAHDEGLNLHHDDPSI